MLENDKKINVFLEEFLSEQPQQPFFSEAALSLRDWMKAYTLLKNDGEFPSQKTQHLRSFQNCLFVAFYERTEDCLKWEN